MKQGDLEVFAKCKRGSDKATAGQECDSTVAYKVDVANSHVTSFRCAKCGYHWSINVGGSFSL